MQELGRYRHRRAAPRCDPRHLIVSYGFNDFDVVEGHLVDSTQFCFSEQFTEQPIETSLSDAATQAIKPPTTPVEVDLVDGALGGR